MGTLVELHGQNTDTLDIYDTEAAVSDCNNPSAHSRLRSVFDYFDERASPAHLLLVL